MISTKNFYNCKSQWLRLCEAFSSQKEKVANGGMLEIDI